MGPHCRENLELGIAAARDALPPGHDYLLNGFCTAAFAALDTDGPKINGTMVNADPLGAIASVTRPAQGMPPPVSDELPRDGKVTEDDLQRYREARATGAAAKAATRVAAETAAGVANGAAAKATPEAGDWAAPMGVTSGTTGSICQVAILGHSKCQYSVKQSKELELLRGGGAENVPTIVMCDQVDDPRCAFATAFPTFLMCDAAQSSMPGYRQGDHLLAMLAM